MDKNKGKFGIYDFTVMSDAEKISIHINNLINTFGEEKVGETLKLFDFQMNKKRLNKKTSNEGVPF